VLSVLVRPLLVAWEFRGVDECALAFAVGALFALLSACPLLVRAGQPGAAGHTMPGPRAAPRLVPGPVPADNLIRTKSVEPDSPWPQAWATRAFQTVIANAERLAEDIERDVRR